MLDQERRCPESGVASLLAVARAVSKAIERVEFSSLSILSTLQKQFGTFQCHELSQLLPHFLARHGIVYFDPASRRWILLMTIEK